MTDKEILDLKHRRNELCRLISENKLECKKLITEMKNITKILLEEDNRNALDNSRQLI